MEKKALVFYDLKAKKKFTTQDYRFVSKASRRFAVTKGPSGIEAWRIVGREK